MKIFDEVKKIEENFGVGVSIQDGLIFNTKLLIRDIEFATNSKYLSGDFDDLGRYKPYYNITNFRLNVATRATDIDVKDINLVADAPQFADKTKVLRKELYEYMKKEKWGQLLNKMGKTRAKYGGLLVKKTNHGGKLKVEVVDWRNVVFDEVEIMKGAIIEKHYLSPIDLNKKRGVWENIDEAVELIGQSKDNDERTEDKLEVWEVHGEFTLEKFKETQGQDIEEKDTYTYSNQKYYMACSEGVPEILLFAEQTKEFPYKYLPYNEREGATLGIGIVEDGLQAQRMVNNFIVAQYNAMELAGKTAIVTNATSLGKNALTDFQTGDVWEVEDGEQVTSVNLAPSAFTAFPNLIEQWDRQYERASSTPESITGETMPSGTPYRAIAIQNQEASSIFSYRLEEMGLFLEEIINEWVLPYLVKKLNKAHILSSEFTPQELQEIDKAYATKRANSLAIEKVLNGEIVTGEDYNKIIEGLVAEQNIAGSSRFLDIPEGYYSDWEGYATVMITNEKKSKAVQMESLSNIMLQVAQAPQILQDPNLFRIFSQIVELSGADISPLDLRPSPIQAQQPTQPQPNQPNNQ